MNWLERSMKSSRLNSVALTWLQGGHHEAPQYRNSGLCSERARANAESTSPANHAIAGPLAAGSGADEAGASKAPASAAGPSRAREIHEDINVTIPPRWRPRDPDMSPRGRLPSIRAGCGSLAANAASSQSGGERRGACLHWRHRGTDPPVHTSSTKITSAFATASQNVL